MSPILFSVAEAERGTARIDPQARLSPALRMRGEAMPDGLLRTVFMGAMVQFLSTALLGWLYG